MVGAVTLTGSAVAFGKLQELLPATHRFQRASRCSTPPLLALATVVIVATLAGGNGGIGTLAAGDHRSGCWA
ncbi:hypothetical protein DSL92_03655 [Billgrantia gudaonensis]|uniref:Uncharacterized protein n=1 Tax=Billgrantia gudaonensis TaxID=376427 RepID=A0A3S0Q1E3_9GAMM|nr:hypothetical protein DSL92_03655 [Halomonas gudaonensis]